VQHNNEAQVELKLKNLDAELKLRKSDNSDSSIVNENTKSPILFDQSPQAKVRTFTEVKNDDGLLDVDYN
jgi:hypothetical protein